MKTKALISNNEEELKKHLSQINQAYDLTDTFTQTIIASGQENRTLSFTSFSIDGDIKAFWMGKKIREHPVQFGTATLAESVMVPELKTYAGLLLQSLHYTGICEIEFLLDPLDGQYKLIEMNARSWLWVGLAKACGIDYAHYVYRYLNAMPTDYPQTFEVGLKWSNEFTDFTFALQAILKGHYSLKTVVNQSKGKKVSALFYPKDHLPFFAYFFLMFKFVFNR